MRVQEGRNVRRECQYRLHTVEPRARVGGAQGEYRIASQRMADRAQSSQIGARREARIDTDGADETVTCSPAISMLRSETVGPPQLSRQAVRPAMQARTAERKVIAVVTVPQKL